MRRKRFLNALPQDELMRRHADRRAELTGEMKRAYVRLFGKSEQ